MSIAADCEELVRKTVETYGRIDIACNNAGIVGEFNGIAKLSIEGWDKTIATNLSGVFYCLKYEIHTMLEQGTGGAIVNTASILGSVGFAAMGAYSAAKHGIVGAHADRGDRVRGEGDSRECGRAGIYRHGVSR